MPENMHDDQLDPAIRTRRYTGQSAVDALNSTVPQADDERRDALEQRLMARVLEGKAPRKNRPMIHNAALQGVYETPRRFQISTSMLLTATVGMLFATVLVFSSFNRPPSEELPLAVAPVNQDQDATAVPVVTITPTALEATATPIPFEGQVTAPPVVPATVVPLMDVTFVPFGGSITPTSMPYMRDLLYRAPTLDPLMILPGVYNVFHVVQEGDTLIGIAERYGIDVDTLIRLNNLDSEAPLVLGQQLVVRLLEMTATPVPFGALPDAVTYTVQEGDTLASIAARYYYDVAELIRLNGLRVEADLFVGQQLILPEMNGMPTDLSMATGVPFVTATPVPFDVNNCIVDDACDMIVLLPVDRIDAGADEVSLAAGQSLNLYVALAVTSEDDSSDIEASLVPVAEGIEVLAFSGEGMATLRVSVEEGIVLNWLLDETPAVISYALAE